MRRFIAVLAVCVCLVCGLSGPAASARTEKARVIPPWAHPFGKSYGQWSAAWWQWAYQTPVDANGPAGEQNPLTVGSGPIDCSYGQSGKVWFLAGTYLSTTGSGGVVQSKADRSCTKPIPAGIVLMIPVLNAEWDNVACPPAAPTSYTEQQLRTLAKQAQDTAHDMSVQIDGRPVRHISGPNTAYRVTSPLFQYRIPQDNLFSTQFVCNEPYPAGHVPPPGAVADGVFVMLAPLAPGEHFLKWGGAATPNGVPFTQAITYTFRVAGWG
jgi:hypothetical protein